MTELSGGPGTLVATDASKKSISPKVEPHPCRGSGSRILLLNAIGLLWVLGAGIAIQIPALVHGIHLGPFDYLSQYGLLKQSGVAVHSSFFGDQIDAIMPWTTLAWTQVHQGHLPLWNPYSGLGAPLAFNWQSAPFSVPAIAGYLVPVQSAYTVGVLITVSIAGTGAFFLGRVLRLGVLGCVMAGTAFELSGPLVSWLGYPHATVMAWAGWIFGAGLLLLRRNHTVRNVAFFAVVLACSVYSGQPEILAILVFYLALFLFVLLAINAWRDGIRSIFGSSVRIAISALLGFLLAAPLLLPGLELSAGSIHAAATAAAPLPRHDLVYLFMQGYDGLPIAGSRMFGPLGSFYLGAYVGVIALVLSVVGVVLRHRRREIIAFAAVTIVSGGIAFASFSSFSESLVKDLSVIGTSPSRSLLPMTFAIAVLAGVGIDALVKSRRPQIWRWSGAGFASAAVVLVVLFIVTVGGLPPTDNAIRERSFIWPVVSCLVGLAATWGLVAVNRRPVERTSIASPFAGGFASHDNIDKPTSRAPVGEPRTPRDAGIGTRRRLIAGVALLVCETAFLITAGAPLWSSSPTFFTRTPAVTALKKHVGGVSEVGMGSNTILCTGLGIDPDVNGVFGIHELAEYDPMIPSTYFSSFKSLTGHIAGDSIYNEYCPAITTVSLARLYGVQYILENAGVPGPRGTKFVAHLGDEGLYQVPDSHPATLTPLAADGSLPPNSALGTSVQVTHPDAASWKMTTDAAGPQVLRLRLSNVPGWHASIDGKPLTLESFAGIMLQARVPAGKHQIELHYWPDSFNAGLILAACTAVGLLVAVAFAVRHRKKLLDAGRPQ